MAIISQAPGAAVQTAAAGGVFVLQAGNGAASGQQLNLPIPPGQLEGVQFTVRASGRVTLAAGTYTAAFKPILYGVAGSAAWTAGSGNALFSATAFAATVSSTVATSFPFSIQAVCQGDSVSGLLQGQGSAQQNNVATAAAAIGNAPTGVNFNGSTTNTGAVLQFAVGVGTANISSAVLDQFIADAA